MLFHLHDGENKNDLEPDVNVKLWSVPVVTTCVWEEVFKINYTLSCTHTQTHIHEFLLFRIMRSACMLEATQTEKDELSSAFSNLLPSGPLLFICP